MKFANCNELFEGWPFGRVCRFVRETGYDGLEIAPFTLAPQITDVTTVRRAELRRQAADAGIEICFGNPGTSEMHFVAAMDREPRIRGVLCLFEGVAAGAADGYARMTGKPAACLLHLGPGFANAISFLHNARKAQQPVVSIVGDHATSHAAYVQAPLTSDR